ncbi:MAG: orotidine 5'-phosphate decarboxylase / HUMPS family protein [Alistipes putredinis]
MRRIRARGRDWTAWSARRSEAGVVKAACGAEFLTVTPGVRFAGRRRGRSGAGHDAGACAGNRLDYIVVGRPITAAADPVAAYRRCVEEFVK